MPPPRAMPRKPLQKPSALTREYIGLLVESFYARIRYDAMLGPVFNSRIKAWPEHLERMKQFWRSVLHNSGSFSGNPMLNMWRSRKSARSNLITGSLCSNRRSPKPHRQMPPAS